MAAPNIVAVVCVVDSSLALLAEWHRVFSEYITPLLQRLHEIHANHQVSPSVPLIFFIMTITIVSNRICVLCHSVHASNPPLVQIIFHASSECIEGSSRGPIEVWNRSDR